MFLYDVTDIGSLEALSEWVSQADNYLSQQCVKMLIGTKSDLEQRKTVLTDKAKAFATW